MRNLLLVVSVVMEVLLNTRAEYQRELAQCGQEQCRQEVLTKITLVQTEIDKINGVAVTWSDISAAIIPNGGNSQ